MRNAQAPHCRQQWFLNVCKECYKLLMRSVECSRVHSVSRLFEY